MAPILWFSFWFSSTTKEGYRTLLGVHSPKPYPAGPVAYPKGHKENPAQTQSVFRTPATVRSQAYPTKVETARFALESQHPMALPNPKNRLLSESLLREHTRFRANSWLGTAPLTSTCCLDRILNLRLQPRTGIQHFVLLTFVPLVRL